ncbi:MAG: formamidopyrimidine-DNA glycosylase [Gemmatimonadetes bacterium]|nr:formamidopyrimidine-DNA glycosylase [Gemmatimonadota bacterium]MBI3568737.1 formamidopyrimidine-DNA glycosylase [Gemmatimonadota bacterium]
MPELPDVTVYVEALERHVGGRVLEHVTVVSPFVLRSVEPPLAALEGTRVTGVRRIGKRIVVGFEGDRFLVIHLMIAGRLRWHAKAPKLNRRLALAAFAFDAGTLVLTEAGTKKRASMHVCAGEDALRAFDRGGLEVLDAPFEAFDARLRSENHTLKRALTDPRLFSGIGNAYSDEILHRARLSPLQLTSKLDGPSSQRLFEAVRASLTEWTARLRTEVGAGFPDKVTAFRDGMAVHGRFRLPCLDCGAPIQRIRYADNETNYCAACQTGGRLLADRAMSRLLKQDWPRSLDEMERDDALRAEG